MHTDHCIRPRMSRAEMSNSLAVQSADPIIHTKAVLDKYFFVKDNTEYSQWIPVVLTLRLKTDRRAPDSTAVKYVRYGYTRRVFVEDTDILQNTAMQFVFKVDAHCYDAWPFAFCTTGTLPALNNKPLAVLQVCAGHNIITDIKALDYDEEMERARSEPPRMLAVAMVSHPRLGRASKLHALQHDVIDLCIRYMDPHQDLYARA